MPLPQSDPILILGGGLMGLAVAHQLAAQGRRVRVISRRADEAAGFVAAGMLAPHAEGLEGALLKLAQTSLARTPAWVARLEADSNLSCGLQPCGIVVPFQSEGQRDRYPTAPWGEPLDRAALEREVPGIGDRWQAGLLFRQDGQIDNRRQLMRALRRACANRGVVVEENCEVLALEQDGAGLRGVIVRRADRVEERLAASRAVLACGAWSGRLLPQLPVTPLKGQMLSLQGPIGALQRVVFGPGTYLVPRADGLLIVGATSEPEAGFSAGLTPGAQRQLQAGIAALLPAAAGWPPLERWWGFRPATPDGAPMLGEGPIPGLWLATGHHRNGVLLAAVTAELVAAAVLAAEDGAPEQRRDPLAPFHWSRFAGPPTGG